MELLAQWESRKLLRALRFSHFSLVALGTKQGLGLLLLNSNVSNLGPFFPLRGTWQRLEIFFCCHNS